MTFCTDIELLHWEPTICHDAAFVSQTLISGSGNLSGTTFTISGASFADAHVQPGQVLVLTSGTNGSYPIVSVESETELTISVLYDGLYPSDDSPVASPVGTGSALPYVIRTFWPQRKITSDLLQQAAGLDPSQDNSARILNPQALRRPCALGTMQMIYNALAAAASDPSSFNTRGELYEKLYRRAIRSAHVELDFDGDGAAEVIRPLNVLQLQRV